MCQSGPMPRFEAFRGLRYEPSVAPVGQVMAPPYDVITPVERNHLAARHSANSVLVELPEADLQGGRDRYAVATELFTRWQAEGIFVPDAGPCLYPYRMTDQKGAPFNRRPGRARVGCPGPGERHLAPRADPAQAQERSARSPAAPPGPTSRPFGGCPCSRPHRHLRSDGRRAGGRCLRRRWRAPQALGALRPRCHRKRSATPSPPPRWLADGHHRYETARTYQSECRANNGDQPGPHDLILALIVELADDQLTVGAIHRTIAACPPTSISRGPLGVFRCGPRRRRR